MPEDDNNNSSMGAGTSSAGESRRDSEVFNQGLEDVKEALFDFACRKQYDRLFTVCARNDYPVNKDIMMSYTLCRIAVHENNFEFATRSLEMLLQDETRGQIHDDLVTLLHYSKFLHISLLIRDLNLRRTQDRDHICRLIQKYFPDRGTNPKNNEKRKLIRKHFLRILSDITLVRNYQENFNNDSKVSRVYPLFRVLSTRIWVACRERNPRKLPELSTGFPPQPAWILLRDHLKGNFDPDEDTLLSFTECLHSPIPNLSCALESFEDSAVPR